MAPGDTTAAAYALQLTIHQRMTTAQRLQSAIELSNFAHDLAAAGLRRREPSLAEPEIPRRLAEILYGRKRSS
jgi:hypothetical protein